MVFDWLIRGGTVLDGTGSPGRLADVGLSGDRVVAVAPALRGEAARVVDAAGCMVAPGFIDMHAHSDFALLTYPSAEVLGTYVRDRGVLSWEGAVHKMTGQAAERLGLTDRGVLRPGAAADVVVFDPRTVDDLATYQAPHRYPAGIRWVWVNGGAVLETGRFHARPTGRVLAPAR